MRVVVISLLICALSFVAGVAGDLSLAAQPQLALMGEPARASIPADAVRAAPLPPLRRAATPAHTARARSIEVAAIIAPLLDKPELDTLAPAPKADPLLAAKRGKDALG